MQLNPALSFSQMNAMKNFIYSIARYQSLPSNFMKFEFMHQICHTPAIFIAHKIFFTPSAVANFERQCLRIECFS